MDLAGIPLCPGVGSACSSERANTVIGVTVQSRKLQLSDVTLRARASASSAGEGHVTWTPVMPEDLAHEEAIDWAT